MSKGSGVKGHEDAGRQGFTLQQQTHFNRDKLDPGPPPRPHPDPTQTPP